MTTLLTRGAALAAAAAFVVAGAAVAGAAPSQDSGNTVAIVGQNIVYTNTLDRQLVCSGFAGPERWERATVRAMASEGRNPIAAQLSSAELADFQADLASGRYGVLLGTVAPRSQGNLFHSVPLEQGNFAAVLCTDSDQRTYLSQTGDISTATGSLGGSLDAGSLGSGDGAGSAGSSGSLGS